MNTEYRSHWLVKTFHVLRHFHFISLRNFEIPNSEMKLKCERERFSSGYYEHHLMMTYPTNSCNVILISHFKISLRLTGNAEAPHAGLTLPITHASERELMYKHNVRSIWLLLLLSQFVCFTICIVYYADAAFHQCRLWNWLKNRICNVIKLFKWSI